MTPKSILTLSDAELENQFGEDISFEGLVSNAQKYKDEVNELLGSEQRGKLIPIFRKIYKGGSNIHRGDLFRAIGDNNRAFAQYSEIEASDAGYNEAQLQLITFTLLSGEEQEETIAIVKSYLKNIDYKSSQHGAACILIGDYHFKIGKKQEALEWYLKVDAEYSPDYEMALSFISQVSEQIEEISLDNGRMVFKKGEDFEVTPVLTEQIQHLEGDIDTPYVVMLSEKDSDNDYAKGKCVFLCTRYEDINHDEDSGDYVQLEELDAGIERRTIIFVGVNSRGELEFRESRAGKKSKVSSPMVNNGIYTIKLTDAQNSIREKEDYHIKDKKQDVLVWNPSSSEAIIIQYGENHPQTILRNIQEELDKGFIGDASDLLQKLEKGSPEYLEGKRLVDEDAAEQTEMISRMIERGDFPTG